MAVLREELGEDPRREAHYSFASSGSALYVGPRLQSCFVLSTVVPCMDLHGYSTAVTAPWAAERMICK